MEKMGWSKGKGLGTKEDGNPLSIAVSLKQDKKGVGWSKKTEDSWIAHQEDFGALLSVLNENHGTAKVTSDSSEGQKVQNLEHTSRSSKGRVHYHKFTKGKDLSVKSESDLDSVFGKRKSKSKQFTAEQLSEEKVLEGKLDGKTTDEDNVGLRTVTSSDSIQDYFAKKMAGIRRKREDDMTDISEKSQILEAKIVESPSSILVNRSYDAESNEYRKDKKITRNSLKVRFSIGEGEMECDESKTDMDTGSFVDEETVDEVYKKKSKKSKKIKRDSGSEYDLVKDDEGACSNLVVSRTTLDTPSRNAAKGKKKRKNKDLNENVVAEETVEQGTVHKTVEESVIEYETSNDISQKKRKKTKTETNLTTEEDKEMGRDNIKADETAVVSSPQRKKKKKSKTRRENRDISAEIEKDIGRESECTFDKNVKPDETVCESSLEKKKKKTKRDKAYIENEKSISNSLVSFDTPSRNAAKGKKKRKNTGLNENAVAEETVEQGTVNKSVEKSVIKYETSNDSSQKKRKKTTTEEDKKMGKDNIQADETVFLSSPQRKKRKKKSECRRENTDISAEIEKHFGRESEHTFDKNAKPDETVCESEVEKDESLSKIKYKDEQEDHGSARVGDVMHEQILEKDSKEESDLSVPQSTYLNSEEVSEKQIKSKEIDSKNDSEYLQFEPPKIVDSDTDLINPFPGIKAERALEKHANNVKQDIHFIFQKEGPLHRPVFAMYVMLGTRSFGAVRCSSKKEAKKKASIVVLNELKEEGELETLEKKKRKRSIRGNKLVKKEKKSDKNELKGEVHGNQSQKDGRENQPQAFPGSSLQERKNQPQAFPGSSLQERKNQPQAFQGSSLQERKNQRQDIPGSSLQERKNQPQAFPGSSLQERKNQPQAFPGSSLQERKNQPQAFPGSSLQERKNQPQAFPGSSLQERKNQTQAFPGSSLQERKNQPQAFPGSSLQERKNQTQAFPGSSLQERKNQPQAFPGSSLQEISGYAGFPVSNSVQIEGVKTYQTNVFDKQKSHQTKVRKSEPFYKRPYQTNVFDKQKSHQTKVRKNEPFYKRPYQTNVFDKQKSHQTKVRKSEPFYRRPYQTNVFDKQKSHRTKFKKSEPIYKRPYQTNVFDKQKSHRTRFKKSEPCYKRPY